MNKTIRLLVAATCLATICRVAEAGWTGVNYQGRLLVGGAPYTGPTNMYFQIYTQLVGGVAIYVEMADAIAVVDGLYTTVMGDNPSPSTPMALQEALGVAAPLYLEISIGKTVLSPREQLNAVPYALNADLLDNLDSSRFLTQFGGTMANTTAAPVLEVSQGGATTNSHAIKGFTASSGAGAAGVFGMAVGPASGIPLEGEAGVRGDSSTGAGVAGLSLQDAGVYGMSSNAMGMLALSLNSYGLQAESLMTNAIYAKGSIKADRLVYAHPRTNFYSVGSHEFHAGGNDVFANTFGAYLTAGVGTLFAPIHLPQGATVIRFDCCIADSVVSTGLVVTLTRYSVSAGDTGVDMAQVASSGSGGWQTVSDTTVSNSVVDNSNYFYSAKCYSGAWSSTNKWYTARVTYTVNEAP